MYLYQPLSLSYSALSLLTFSKRQAHPNKAYFKAKIKVNGGRFLVLIYYQVPSFLQPLIHQPVPWRIAKHLLEVALEACGSFQ
jgi:hypothetical protein